MSKEVYRRLSKVERKLENTNRLRTNNTTLRIKYEGIKKLLEKKNKEIERLNNIINKGIEAINVYQNEKTLSVGYEDLKRIRGILRGNEFDLQMFEEYLQELKGEIK